MPQGYIKEATYLVYNLYCHGKWFNSWILQSVIQVSSLESKRLLEVPERSLGGFPRGGCLNDTSRKIHINFQVSTVLESGLTPGYSIATSKCHPWSLRGRRKILRGVLVVFENVDLSRITSRKLRINLKISTCPGNAPFPMCLQSIIMESKKTLEVPDRGRGGVGQGGCVEDAGRRLHIN